MRCLPNISAILSGSPGRGYCTQTAGRKDDSVALHRPAAACLLSKLAFQQGFGIFVTKHLWQVTLVQDLSCSMPYTAQTALF